MRVGPSFAYSTYRFVERLLRSVRWRQSENNAEGQEGRQHRRESPGPLLIVGRSTIPGECQTENDRK
jgi:hypothetical protein